MSIIMFVIFCTLSVVAYIEQSQILSVGFNLIIELTLSSLADQ